MFTSGEQLPVFDSIHPSIHPSIHQSINQSINQSFHICIRSSAPCYIYSCLHIHSSNSPLLLWMCALAQYLRPLSQVCECHQGKGANPRGDRGGVRVNGHASEGGKCARHLGALRRQILQRTSNSSFPPPQGECKLLPHPAHAYQYRPGSGCTLHSAPRQCAVSHQGRGRRAVCCFFTLAKKVSPALLIVHPPLTFG